MKKCTSDDVLRFWYEEKGPAFWYEVIPDFDAEVRRRFEPTHEAAASGELFSWRATPSGRLAEVIVLDQFGRNMFRDTARAFAADSAALVLAQEAVRLGVHEELGDRKSGILMPYMHSESRLVHEQALSLFACTQALDWEVKHKEVIDRFGRYPSRNAVLGRRSTPEEEAFLAEFGAGF